MNKILRSTGVFLVLLVSVAALFLAVGSFLWFSGIESVIFLPVLFFSLIGIFAGYKNGLVLEYLSVAALGALIFELGLHGTDYSPYDDGVVRAFILGHGLVFIIISHLLLFNNQGLERSESLLMRFVKYLPMIMTIAFWLFFLYSVYMFLGGCNKAGDMCGFGAMIMGGVSFIGGIVLSLLNFVLYRRLNNTTVTKSN